jgi:hypothetical protein
MVSRPDLVTVGAMPLRCRNCKAWKIGNRIIYRTDRTDFCSRCDPVNAPARLDARIEAKIAADNAWLRQWLLSAPRFEDSLLDAARAAGPLGEHPMAPWVDTLDLDDIIDNPKYLQGAVSWLYSHSSTGGRMGWPPATNDACFRLANTLNVNPRRGFESFEHTPFDIGSVFGQRGFPYPPDPTRHRFDDLRDDPNTERNIISVKAGVKGFYEAMDASGKSRGEPLEVTWLPNNHTDMLTFELEVMLWHGQVTEPSHAQQDAVGSIYRDDTDRVIVVWR